MAGGILRGDLRNRPGWKIRIWFGDAILKLLSSGQWVIPEIITDLAQQIEFGGHLGLAERWYPLRSHRSIVLDPAVAHGRPSIVGSGVMTANIHLRFPLRLNTTI